MNTENIAVGARIRSMREFQQLSREKLAEKANISTQFLADIENCKKGMTVVTLKKICDALSTTADSIVYGANFDDNTEISAMLRTVPKDKQNDVEKIIQLIIKNLN